MPPFYWLPEDVPKDVLAAMGKDKVLFSFLSNLNQAGIMSAVLV
jgi:hypothetical protein